MLWIWLGEEEEQGKGTGSSSGAPVSLECLRDDAIETMQGIRRYYRIPPEAKKARIRAASFLFSARTWDGNERLDA